MSSFFDILGRKLHVNDKVFVKVAFSSKIKEGIVLNINEQMTVLVSFEELVAFDSTGEKEISIIKISDIEYKEAILRTDALGNRLDNGDSVVFSHHAIVGLKMGEITSSGYVRYDNNGIELFEYVNTKNIINISSLKKSRPELFL